MTGTSEDCRIVSLFPHEVSPHAQINILQRSLRTDRSEHEPTPLTKAAKIMNQLRSEQKLADIIIICGNEQYSAHKIVLAAFSPFFRNLLISQSGQNTTSTLVLDDVEKVILEKLLEFMYTGQINLTSLSTKQVLNLLTSGYLLKVIRWTTKLVLEVD